MVLVDKRTHKRKIKNKKIAKIFSKLYLVVLLFIVLSILFWLNIKKFYKSYNEDKRDYLMLNRNLRTINTQIRDIESKSVASKKYIETWKTEMSEVKKNMSGLNIEDMRVSLEKLVKNNLISGLKTSFTLPTQVSGVFSRNSIRVLTSLISMDFNTITDINAYTFIDDIENLLPGSFTVEYIQMKKIKKVDKNYIDQLSSGSLSPSLAVSVRIRWYAFEPIKKR